MDTFLTFFEVMANADATMMAWCSYQDGLGKRCERAPELMTHRCLDHSLVYIVGDEGGQVFSIHRTLTNAILDAETTMEPLVKVYRTTLGCDYLRDRTEMPFSATQPRIYVKRRTSTHVMLS